eukprot:TRINITY_DN5278_c0_g4_i1.p1 TRINITY_DN5278_c0_g4~~TRINITY_DN5278_c0_g4_i1.p1  ORF type:complete len:399 (+),score=137.77 TRINITY_DN5278_c0_g4_i1:152-1348(+)
MEAFDQLHLPPEKRAFILEKLNPLLEHMAAECIRQMPEDPVPFLLDCLEAKRIQREEQGLNEQERDRLIAENQALQEDVKRVGDMLGEAAAMAQLDEQDEEEDEEDEEPPPDFFKEHTSNKARASVSAEAYGEWNQKKAFRPPTYPKTPDQKERLKTCLKKSFMFACLENSDMELVIGAMQELLAEKGDRLIKMGEQGNYLFVIEVGEIACSIPLNDGVEKVVKTCHAGDVFGELALLYNCPRAAHVDAVTSSTLWKLDRETFNHIVKEASQQKRRRYDAFLSKVPLLASMDAYERSQVADALQSETFEVGAIIMHQGDPGNKFYILEEGAAAATKGAQEVMRYGPGDYFGELALIRNQPRAATVTCLTAVRLLSLNGAGFKRLLNVHQLLERSTSYT